LAPPVSYLERDCSSCVGCTRRQRIKKAPTASACFRQLLERITGGGGGKAAENDGRSSERGSALLGGEIAEEKNASDDASDAAKGDEVFSNS
jgi:hypothetical protein